MCGPCASPCQTMFIFIFCEACSSGSAAVSGPNFDTPMSKGCLLLLNISPPTTSPLADILPQVALLKMRLELPCSKASAPTLQQPIAYSAWHPNNLWRGRFNLWRRRFNTTTAATTTNNPTLLYYYYYYYYYYYCYYYYYHYYYFRPGGYL